MGNVDGSGFVAFDTRDGGFDGHRSYEIVNLQADVWRDVGNWNEDSKLEISHTIQWPGGKTITPKNDRDAYEDPTTVVKKEDDLPDWVTPIIIITLLIALSAVCCIGYIYHQESKGDKKFFGYAQHNADGAEMTGKRGPN